MQDNQSKKGKATDHDKIIGQNLKKIRLLKGWSQQELAENSNITFQQIQKYENGSNRISASRLLEFCNTMNVDLSVFYGTLLKNSDTKEFANLSPNVLKILSLLEHIEDKELLKQIEKIIKSLSSD